MSSSCFGTCCLFQVILLSVTITHFVLKSNVALEECYQKLSQLLRYTISHYAGIMSRSRALSVVMVFINYGHDQFP